MTRHGKNATASAVYSYEERKKDTLQSGYGTLRERLGADSVKQFDCCSLTLQPCRQPVITRHGFVYDKQSILEYILQQKRLNAKKMKEYEKQRDRDEKEADELAKAEHEAVVKRFVAVEGTPAHPGAGSSGTGSGRGEYRLADSVSNVAGDKRLQLPSFWIPSLNPSAPDSTKIDKPSQKVLCPMSGKVLKVKDLMSVTFTLVKDGDATTSSSGAKKARYMCPVTHDALTNVMRLAYLKTSGNVVTMDCVEKIIRKDMIDPSNGKVLSDSDIIELQRGGTGFSATNKLDAKMARPVLELQ